MASKQPKSHLPSHAPENESLQELTPACPSPQALNALAADELSPDAARELLIHVVHCAYCRVVFHNERLLLKHVAQAKDKEAP